MQLKEISMKKTEEQKLEKLEDEERRKKIDREAYEQKLREKQKIEDYKVQCKK
jgi:hypothetical protein